jgi:hypothetical protein
MIGCQYCDPRDGVCPFHRKHPKIPYPKFLCTNCFQEAAAGPGYWCRKCLSGM